MGAMSTTRVTSEGSITSLSLVAKKVEDVFLRTQVRFIRRIKYRLVKDDEVPFTQYASMPETSACRLPSVCAPMSATADFTEMPRRAKKLASPAVPLLPPLQLEVREGTRETSAPLQLAASMRPVRKGRMRGHAGSSMPKRSMLPSAPGASVVASSMARLPAYTIKSARERDVA